jgi:hypothetical protein
MHADGDGSVGSNYRGINYKLGLREEIFPKK